jgi:hypothetical protein
MKKRSQQNVVICFCAICLLLVGHSAAQQASPAPSRDGQPTASATVPRLVRLSGGAKDAQGRPLSGVVGITFALYKDQDGGAPLWMEVQNVQLDGNGRYIALLGASTAEGVPLELFSANEARWLGVQPENQAEQPRVLLVSVPYALKAAEAESLGGKPASAYVLSPTAGTPAASPTKTASPAAACSTPPCDVITSGGTAGFIPMFTDPTTVQNSTIFQSNGLVGIGNASPTRTLDVNGEIRVAGGNIFMQRNLTDLAGRRNWAWGTETFNVGDVSLFVSTSNTAFPSVPVFTALSNGSMGVGLATPTQKLDVAGTVKATSFVAQGAPSQSANLQEWQDNSGNAIALVNSGGAYIGPMGMLLRCASFQSTNLTTAGTGSIALLGDGYIRLQSGTTASSFADVRDSPTGQTGVGDGIGKPGAFLTARVNWSHSPDSAWAYYVLAGGEHGGATLFRAFGFKAEGAALKGVTREAGNETLMDLGTTLTTEFVNLLAVRRNASVDFYVNGVLKGTSTTNLPLTANSSYEIRVLNGSSGTNAIMEVYLLSVGLPIF